ncbi:hypothetical protein J27TS7_06760 [Paenibacillus dendritiformis]|uniref:non-ribosomal peptide synthetase n=1 Tax=Paenibacillus dendritiformis TaxID=130049 RepID=UPI001B1D8D46|nr:non-ribosomal peptide synthetase [Paenibacillus dendritiformis]GIO71162.1 hypothetical protein J27TS7_06760 [Paenibacillus dendritiformis]
MTIFNKQELFWNSVFDVDDQITYLPYLKPASKEADFNNTYSSLEASLSAECSERVITIANQSQMAIYMILLAGVNCLLHKYTGKESIIFGMPSLKSTIHDQTVLSDILIIKNKVDRSSSFRTVFKQLNVFIKEAIEHQHIPFRKMTGNLNLLYDHNNLPKVNIIISLDGLHHCSYIEAVASDVRFEFYITNHRIHYKLVFDESLYDKEFIIQIAEHLDRIFSIILFEPDLDFGQLKLLTIREESEIFTVFNNTTEYDQWDKTVHSIFEEQVEIAPDRIAVVYEGQKLTYKQLNERANQLAHALLKEGIKTEQLVGILVERSLEMVIGILGILKAGGAYVPIDPEYPEARIQYIIKDSDIKQLLTQRHLQNRFNFAGNVMFLDEENDSLQDISNPGNFAGPNHLAYVIYTSGTTGNPKGVMVEHQSIVNTLTQLEKNYPLKTEDSILLKTNYTFDVSVTELFGWFFGSGRLVILKPNLEKNPEALLNIILEEKITHINFVPSMLQMLLHSIKPTDAKTLKSLQYVFAAGEALPIRTIEEFYACGLRARLINVYGPTETTIYASEYTTSESTLEFINTPIGKPFGNMQAYILNSENHPQPIGVTGELCLSGVGLARGYWNRPDLTAERFVPNVLDSSKRMYRTGDLARWLPDGNIEYLGRIDDQVKIRGYRIEIGEIETALLKVETVKSVVVTALENENGNKALCAYIVAERDYAVSELKEILSKQLPSYMIPSYFVQIEQIPLTPNGKIDRKALPVPKGNMKSETHYVAPRTTIEQALVEVWQNVLGVRPIGVFDNFYNLGGDSIKSIQVSSRMYQAGYGVEMRHLLKYPTIAELSMYVQPTTVVSDQGEIVGAVPLTPIQSWFFESNFEDQYFNQAMMLYKEGRFDIALLRNVMTHISKHHDALRSVFAERNNKVEMNIRGSEEGTLYTLDVFDFQNEEDLANTIEITANTIQSSMNIGEGPMMKLGLFRCAHGDHLLIVIHHLVIDMVSWRILLEDFATLYGQIENGNAIQVPQKSDSYKLWSKRLSEYAEGSEIKKELMYWEHIEQTVQHKLPKDYENNVVFYDSSDVIAIQWSEQETASLLKNSNQAYNTEINDLLLTALAIAVHKWTGIEEILLSLEGHGRETIMPDLDVTRTIGWFTSQYPVLLPLKPNHDLSSHIKTVKEVLRAIPNKGIGYGILRYISNCWDRHEYLKPEIRFNYLGQFDQDFELSGLKVSEYSIGSVVSGKTIRMNMLDITGLVQNGRLTFKIDYSLKQYRNETIHQFANWIKESLQDIIHHCASKETVELTPSDLTLKGMTTEELTQVIEQTSYIGEIEDLYELTPLQKGMLFHSMKDSHAGAFFEQLSFDLHVQLNVKAWVKSYEALMKTHSILRSNVYQGWKDTPLQIIYKQKACEWLFEDLRSLSFEEREKHLASYMITNKARGFKLEKDTLSRIAIMQTDNHTYRVIWSFHHIIMDGWCMPLVIKEWIYNYEVLIGEKAAKNTLITPYSRYIEWLAEQDGLAAANYWKEYLANYQEHTVIPYFKSNHAEAFSTETLACELDMTLTDRLHQIANRNQVTMSTLMQTMWGILLQKYNNSEDVVFGTVVSGRPEVIPGIESMIGLFINTIPVRVRSEKWMTAAQLMQHIQRSMIATKPYEAYPLFEIHAKTEQKQDLINHILVFENYPLEQDWVNEKINNTKLKITSLKVEEQTNYNFNVLVIPGHKMEVRFQYNANVYDRINVEKIGRHFVHLLRQISQNPDVLIKNLSVITDAEKTEIFEIFNNTKTLYPRDKTIYELFEEQAERVPDQIAVVYEGQQLTYRELNQRANQLARTLREIGIGLDQRIGIMVERSLEMIVGIIAILKSGGAYVPIDPDYPEERIRYMLDDSEAKLLLTQSHLKIPEVFSGISLNIDKEHSYHVDRTNLELLSSSSNLAYVIYTSGTTGKPKGNLTVHRNIIRVVKNTNYIEINQSDKVLQFSNYAFDGSTFDIFGALLNGAQLVMAPKETMLNVRQLAALIEEKRISVMFMTTAFFNVLVDIDVNCLKHVQKILFGGEQVSVKHVRKALQFLGPNKLKHVYGPTESTVFATCYDINEVPIDAVNIPIGQPISNTEIYIVDSANQLQPVGIIGELCIGGDGLARGYLNHPELTADKFQENPFMLGEKMYRTGDLARWLLDGNIEFLGRTDYQVKIRGYRIEIGEVETALLSVEGVKEAVVTVHEDQKGDKSLCAYFVANQIYQPNEMEERLLTRLPNYMIPSYFAQIEQMPLTSHGKVDRKALPIIDIKNQAGSDYVAPRNTLEKELAEIWREVLGIKQMGIKDNFFNLGGHSLRATTLVAKIHKRMNINIALREVFNSPTIEQLAKAIQNLDQLNFVSIPRAEHREFYPVSSSQKRMYILTQLEGANISYNIPSMLRIKGAIDLEKLNSVFKQLIDRHESLRTSFEIIQGELVQRIHDVVDFTLNLRKVTQGQLNEYTRQFIRPFSLKEAPLLRVELLEIEPLEHLLFIDMHHIISDGVSMNVFIRELFQLYEGRELPAINNQYKDFAVWQQDEKQQEHKRQQEEYWVELLKGDLPVLQLPTDFVRPAIQSFEGATHKFIIDKQRSDALKQLAEETESTMYMVMLALFTTILAKYSGQDDIIVGSPIAGRIHADLEHVIGMFVNTLPMRNYPTREKTFAEYLGQVKENALKAYENKDYPFEELVEKLDVSRDLSRNPIFDVMFSFQNLEQNVEGIHGLEIEPYEFNNSISKFDLTLVAFEKEDQFHCMLEYATSLFKEQSMIIFERHFMQLIESIIGNPHKKLSEVSIITQSEKADILDVFNNTKAEYPEDKTIHELFEEQAERVPDQIAVVYEGKTLSYKELNQRSNRLARRLRAEGVAVDQRIGIMVERSLEMIVGILGVLKAGGAYVPIDAEYPADRICYMLDDSGANLLLTQSHLQGRIAFEGTILCLDESCSYDEDGSNLEPAAGSNDLAYVIYTSGTTGKPKGVMVEHRGLCNLNVMFEETLQITEKDRIVQFASLSFDAACWEIYKALLLGATLYIPTAATIRDYSLFEAFMDKHKITASIMPPNYVNYLNPEHMPSLTKLITGGSASSVELVEAWKDHVKYFNAYGPTEASIVTALWSSTEEGTGLKSVPIGRPIQNHQIYILDGNGDAAPIGMVGELCIGGVGLARGYLNRPELTAEKFVSNRFAPGERMYRTGDLGRWLPDGNIEYLGRLDDQVKIRGYRIEIGEVESALLSVGDVKEATVVAHQDEKGEKTLCAYFVANQSYSVSEIKGVLSEKLPQFMIPSYFVQLEQMPITANGKIDRKALPVPDGKLQTGTEYVAPRNTMEATLTEIWQEVLGLKKVGVKDNFFDLGGNSLKILSLVQCLTKKMGVSIDFQTVFYAPTVELMAMQLQLIRSNLTNVKKKNTFIQLNKYGKINIFCFPPPPGIGLVYMEMAKLLESECVVNVTDFIDHFENYEAMLYEYVKEISSIQNEGPYVLCGYSGGGNLAFEVAKTMEQSGMSVSDIIMIDTTPWNKEVHMISTQLMHDIAKENDLKYNKRKYLDYMDQLTNLGKVSANLHNIVVETVTTRYKKKWRDYTWKVYKEYNGYGKHDELLHPVYVKENIKIIKRIVDEIVNSKMESDVY